jgi:hypothetical protein
MAPNHPPLAAATWHGRRELDFGYLRSPLRLRTAVAARATPGRLTFTLSQAAPRDNHFAKAGDSNHRRCGSLPLAAATRSGRRIGRPAGVSAGARPAVAATAGGPAAGKEAHEQGDKAR